MKCVLVGEAWGEQEASYEAPFVGAAGQELARMMHQAGLLSTPLSYKYISALTMRNYWASCPYPLLNVFSERPSHDSNNVELFYAHLKDNIPVTRTYPARKFGSKNLYVRSDKAHHIETLHKQIAELKPNLIIALGATACWTLGLGASIGKLRGFVHDTPYGKVLPTYHPAAILYNWSLRATTLLDFVKAKREMQFSGFHLTEREIWTEPTIDDLWEWWELYGKASKLLAVDIETLRKQQISEIGFASDSQHALHIPFCWLEGKTYKSWFPDVKTEAKAWQFVRHVCASPVPKIGQNFQYDAYWLAKHMGIYVRNWQHDTMVASHCWQPELGKGLYDLGALFLNEKDWKSIRKDSMKDKDDE